jgi:hypothetical protein
VSNEFALAAVLPGDCAGITPKTSINTTDVSQGDRGVSVYLLTRRSSVAS